MARTRSIQFESRREEILNAALRVFARKGFDTATNTEIAAEAGIGSAALLYHYFDSKEAIFRAVLDREAPGFRAVAELDADEDTPLGEALFRFAIAFLSVLDHPEAVSMLKLALGEAVRRPSAAESYNRAGPGRLFGVLTDYFGRHIQSGRIRAESPAIATRLFLGPLVVYVLGRAVLGQEDARRVAPERMARETVRCFLAGVAPGEAGPLDEEEETHACLD